MVMGIRARVWDRMSISKIVKSSPDVTLRPAELRLTSKSRLLRK